MKFNIKFWNRRIDKQDEATVEIDKSSDGFLKKMARMRLQDSSFGLVDRTVKAIIKELLKSEIVDSITAC